MKQLSIDETRCQSRPGPFAYFRDDERRHLPNVAHIRNVLFPFSPAVTRKRVELSIIQQCIHLFHCLRGEKEGQKRENVERIIHGGIPALSWASSDSKKQIQSLSLPL